MLGFPRLRALPAAGSRRAAATRVTRPPSGEFVQPFRIRRRPRESHCLQTTRSTQMTTCRFLPIIAAAAWFLPAAAGATLALIEMSAAQQQQPQPLLAPLQKNQIVYLDTPAPPDTIPVAQPDFD